MRLAGRWLLPLLLAGAAAGCGVVDGPGRPDRLDASGPHVFVVRVREVSFEQLLSVPEVAALAHRGGAALMSDTGALTGGTLPGVDEEITFAPSSALELRDIGPRIVDRVTRLGRSPVLVFVVGVGRSKAMVGERDELSPLVMAEGAPNTLFRTAGSTWALSSDSTRRPGVVVDVDVEATISAFRYRAGPGDGSPIRVVDAPAPFALHRRYLAMRRMTVPIQTAAALYVTLGGLFGIALLSARRRLPSAMGVVASGLAISVGPLGVALLAAGHLPSLSYATVLPFVIAVTVVLVGLVLLGATRDLLHPVLPLGVAILAALVVESLLGWTAALTPFLGGSELDGGRFYGLPNVFIGLVLGASMYAAARLPALTGFALILAAALFAGLPFAGANLGGAVTLFAAAGLWLPLRKRGRLGVREVAFAAAVVVVGTAAVLLAHRFLTSSPTHVTRFEETTSAGGALRTFIDRLGVGWALIRRNPFALVPVVGLVVTLAAVVRPPAPVRAGLSRDPAWRDAILVILVASVVAYVANDTGPAACGVGFGMGLGGLLYVSCAERTWKMGQA